MDGYPKENLVNVFSSGTQVTDKLICNYEDRLQLASDLLGSSSSTLLIMPAQYTVAVFNNKLYSIKGG